MSGIQTSKITTAADQNLVLDPNGTGEVILQNNAGAGETPISVDNAGVVKKLDVEYLTDAGATDAGDLLMLQRGDSLLKIDAGSVGGAGQALPSPEDVTADPPFESGSGTLTDPWYITPSVVNEPGGSAESAQNITVINQKPGSILNFQVLDGSSRFNKEAVICSASGSATFRLDYNDVPESKLGALYEGSIQMGNVYFRWDVTQIKNLTSFGPEGTPTASPADVNYSTDAKYGTVTGTWADGDQPLTVTGDVFISDGSSWQKSLNPTNGDTVLVKFDELAVNAADEGTLVQGTIANGSGFLLVPSMIVDRTPDPFSFADLTATPVSAAVTFSAITLTGINAPTVLNYVAAGTTLTSPEASIDGGSWTAIPATGATGLTVNPGDSIQVRGTTGAVQDTGYTLELNVNSVTTTATATTFVGGGGGVDPVIYTPTILTPFNGATDLNPADNGNQILLQGSSYGGANTPGTHTESDWEVYRADGTVGNPTSDVITNVSDGGGFNLTDRIASSYNGSINADPYGTALKVAIPGYNNNVSEGWRTNYAQDAGGLNYSITGGVSDTAFTTPPVPGPYGAGQYLYVQGDGVSPISGLIVVPREVLDNEWTSPTESFTFETWMCLDSSNPNGSQEDCIFSRYAAESQSRLLNLVGSGTTAMNLSRMIPGKGYTNIPVSDVPGVNKWFHISFSYDGATSTMYTEVDGKMYVNSGVTGWTGMGGTDKGDGLYLTGYANADFNPNGGKYSPRAWFADIRVYKGICKYKSDLGGTTLTLNSDENLTYFQPGDSIQGSSSGAPVTSNITAVADIFRQIDTATTNNCSGYFQPFSSDFNVFLDGTQQQANFMSEGAGQWGFSFDLAESALLGYQLVIETNPTNIEAGGLQLYMDGVLRSGGFGTGVTTHYINIPTGGVKNVEIKTTFSASSSGSYFSLLRIGLMPSNITSYGDIQWFVQPTGGATLTFADNTSLSAFEPGDTAFQDNGYRPETATINSVTSTSAGVSAYVNNGDTDASVGANLLGTTYRLDISGLPTGSTTYTFREYFGDFFPISGAPALTVFRIWAHPSANGNNTPINAGSFGLSESRTADYWNARGSGYDWVSFGTLGPLSGFANGQVVGQISSTAPAVEIGLNAATDLENLRVGDLVSPDGGFSTPMTDYPSGWITTTNYPTWAEFSADFGADLKQPGGIYATNTSSTWSYEVYEDLTIGFYFGKNAGGGLLTLSGDVNNPGNQTVTGDTSGNPSIIGVQLQAGSGTFTFTTESGIYNYGRTNWGAPLVSITAVGPGNQLSVEPGSTFPLGSTVKGPYLEPGTGTVATVNTATSQMTLSPIDSGARFVANANRFVTKIGTPATGTLQSRNLITNQLVLSDGVGWVADGSLRAIDISRVVNITPGYPSGDAPGTGYTLVDQSLADSSNLTSYSVPGTAFSAENDYYTHVRYRSASTESNYSPWSKFSTAAETTTSLSTALWTGNGVAQSITTGTTPDLVWIKARTTGTGNQIYDVLRNATKKLDSGTQEDAQDIVNGLTNFTSDGFTIQDNGGVNSSGIDYVGWTWSTNGALTSIDATGSISSTTKAASDGSFSIVTYNGNGVSGSTVGHGLGQVPDLIIVKKFGGSGYPEDWRVYHSGLTSAAQKSLVLNGTGPADFTNTIWNDTPPTSSVFTIGSNPNVNTDGGSYVAYCWSATTGISDFGSYVGDATREVTVNCGFEPKFVMIRGATYSANWNVVDNARDPNNPRNNWLRWNSSSPEIPDYANFEVEFTSTGFIARSGTTTDSDIIHDGQTSIYAAFA